MNSAGTPVDWPTNGELIAEQIRADREFQAEWERTTLARAVAVAMIRYRTENALSQRQLADRLRMKQPQVARLELGEVNPTMETLMRLASSLDLEFTIDIRRAGSPARNITERAQREDVVGVLSAGGSELVVAAS
jgi:ribosome-binding protein aMBF1 (putative translation factor)